jgi:biopolymer transport protein ExbD
MEGRSVTFRIPLSFRIFRILLMKRHTDRQALSSLSELNITPLVDLAFVLLIIFMITTPLIERTVELEVPASSTAEGEVSSASARIITIRQSGELLWADQAVAASELPARLTAWKQQAGAEAGVILRADKDVSVETLVKILDAVKTAGIPRVGVATQPVKSRE